MKHSLLFLLQQVNNVELPSVRPIALKEQWVPTKLTDFFNIRLGLVPKILVDSQWITYQQQPHRT